MLPKQLWFTQAWITDFWRCPAPGCWQQILQVSWVVGQSLRGPDMCSVGSVSSDFWGQDSHLSNQCSALESIILLRPPPSPCCYAETVQVGGSRRAYIRVRGPCIVWPSFLRSKGNPFSQAACLWLQTYLEGFHCGNHGNASLISLVETACWRQKVIHR